MGSLVARPLQYRFNQKMAKYAQVAQEHDFSFTPAISSHTGQVHQTAMDLMFNQIKHKMELVDPEVQSCEVQNMLNFWVKQLSCVVNRTACRSILAGVTSLVDSVNASSGDAWTYAQRDELSVGCEFSRSQLL